MNLSPGIVNDCVKIVSLYFGEPLNSIPIESSQLYRCKNINYSLYFLKYINVIDKDGWNNIISLEDKKDIYIDILKLYVLKRNILRKRIKYGLVDLIDNSLSSNEKACFRDAGLLDYYKDKVVLWWYALSDSTDENEMKRITTGYFGEKWSIQYESTRLNINKKRITHTSLYTSNAGFDILSYNNNEEKINKPIEVKTISDTESPFIYITENEYNKSGKLDNYVFHIWVIDKLKNIHNLYIFKRADFIDDWPIVQGEGALTGSIKINMKSRLKKLNPIFSSENS